MATISASSRRAPHRGKSGPVTPKAEGRATRQEWRSLTAQELAGLEKLRNVPDEEIDFSDIPDSTAQELASAVRGKFYRLRKHQVTLRLDGPIIDWFKSHARNGKGYQTDINAALREYIAAKEKKPARKKAG